MLTEVLPRANRAMVTNNSTVLTEVSANRNRANRGVAVHSLNRLPDILFVICCFGDLNVIKIIK